MQPPENNSPQQDKLDRASLRSVGLELGDYFPQPLQETRLVLMEISPHRLHAYWHITGWDLKAANHHTGTGDTQLVIRFHDLTEPRPNAVAPPTFDIEIEKTSGSIYVELWEDAKRYVAELGIHTGSGLIIDLARSNTVEMPRAGYAGQQPTGVLTLTPEANRLYRAEADRIDSVDPNTKPQREHWKENQDQPADLTLRAGSYRLEPEFPDPSSRSTPPERAEGLPANGTTCNNVERAPRFRLYQASGLLAESGEGSAWLKREPPAATGQPATQGRPADVTDGQQSAKLPRQDSPAQSSAATDPSPVSSFATGTEVDDCLQVDLVIRGKSRTNCHFVLHGQAIQTGDDGSFLLQQRLAPRTLQQIAQLLEACREKK